MDDLSNVKKYLSEESINILSEESYKDIIEDIDYNFTLEDIINNSEYIDEAIRNGVEITISDVIKNCGVGKIMLKTPVIKFSEDFEGYFFEVSFWSDPKNENFFEITKGASTLSGWLIEELNVSEACKGIPIWDVENLKKACNKCPICEEDVNFEKMHGYAFAGYCCEECLPGEAQKAREELFE